MQVKLSVVLGDDAGKEFVIDRPGTVIVGREAAEDIDFQICAADRRFSRYHFKLEVTDMACLVRDMGSRNGTFVNGKRIKEAPLHDGDVIHAGRKEPFVQFQVKIDPLAGAKSSKLDDGVANQADVSKMVTLPIGGGAARRTGTQPACPVCGEKMPKDAWIHDLLKTDVAVAYVCPKHLQALTDAQHPVPNYEVLEVLGTGTIGPVYKARRVSSNKIAVLKVVPERLTSNRELMKVFQRHMRLSARLQNPHIAQVIEMGQAGQQLWLATEFVAGRDAEQLARSLGGVLPLADAVEITCQVLSALDSMHHLNLVHRDIKPSNIMVSGTAGQYAAKLADFVLVKDTDESPITLITEEGVQRGTEAFMAPEQAIDSRSVKPEADLYGMGATLYWLLTGEFVYDFTARDARGDVKDAFRVITEDPQIPIRKRDPAIPEAVARVIEAALQRDPEDRFPSATEMIAALRRAMAS